MPGLSREACEVKCYQLKDDDEHLRGIVPESYDLFQVLHHAYTYGTDRSYYAISSHVALLYLIQISFCNSLLRAYQSITDWLYDQVCAQFYVPGPEVPVMSPDLATALKDDRFSHLKMSNHTLQCYLGLWRAININTPEGIYFPLPPLARIVPWLVAVWNTTKGGGDTLTRMSDICQEQIGIGSENLVACARVLVNLGLVFPRCNQMCTSRDPDEYPTLHHLRNAAKQRFATKDSFKILGNILLEMATAGLPIS